MDTGVIAQWAATGVISIGLLAAHIRLKSSQRSESQRENSKEKKKANGRTSELENDVKNIKDAVSDENNGLGAIRRAVEEQRLHCAYISTQLTTKVQALEERAEK